MITVSRRRIGEFWCKMMHPSPMWPSHGHYRCRTCGRKFTVPWEFDLRERPPQHRNERLLADASPLVGTAIARAPHVAHSS